MGSTEKEQLKLNLHVHIFKNEHQELLKKKCLNDYIIIILLREFTFNLRI